jgi:anti-sigma B factor antagonist
MTIINRSLRADVPVLVVDQERLTEGFGLDYLYQDVIEELANGAPHLVLDFRLVQFMSSAGVTLLIRVKRRCVEKKISLHLCNLSPAVAQVFRITEVHRLFQIYETVADALRVIDEGAFGAELA